MHIVLHTFAMRLCHVKRNQQRILKVMKTKLLGNGFEREFSKTEAFWFSVDERKGGF